MNRTTIRDVHVLRNTLALRDLTQSQLARRVEARIGRPCPRQVLSRLFTGERLTCAADIATAVEEVLQVAPTALFVPEKSPTRRLDVAASAMTRLELGQSGARPGRRTAASGPTSRVSAS